MSFNPKALNERTVKQFVDRLLTHRQSQSPPTHWPPKRSQVQEEIAAVLGFKSWHEAIHAIRTDPTPPVAGPAFSPNQATHLYPKSPTLWQGSDMEQFLTWAHREAVPTISIQANAPILVHLPHGVRTATIRPLTSEEVKNIITHLYGSEHWKFERQGVDFAYQHKMGENKARYRVITSRWMDQNTQPQFSIQIRHIASTPPALSELIALDHPAVRAAMQRTDGLVLVAGSAGSGKTTLISSFVRHLLEGKPPVHVKKIENPVEFEYEGLVIPPTNLLTQCDLTQQSLSSGQVLRQMMKQGASDIVLGHLDDALTLGQLLEACEQTRVWSCVNSARCSDAIRRCLSSVPKEDVQARFEDLMRQLRVVIAQRLVPGVDGRLVALREYLILDQASAEHILDAGVANVVASVNHIIQQSGYSLLADAQRQYQAGLISRSIYDNLARAW